jgi:hypothetical protein
MSTGSKGHIRYVRDLWAVARREILGRFLKFSRSNPSSCIDPLYNRDVLQTHEKKQPTRLLILISLRLHMHARVH